MKQLFIGSVALLALVATGPAVAADMPARAPVYKASPAMVAAHNWTGFYLGGHVGGTWMDASETFTNQFGFADPLDFRASSFIGGGHVGLQGQWGNVVLGIEGSFSATGLDDTVPSINPGGPRTRTVKVEDIATVVGKIGYAADAWMIYVKGGWADLRVNTGSLNTANNDTSNVTRWHNGWTVGGGFDYMFGQNWIAGVDFNYYTATFDRGVVFSDDGLPGTVTDSRARVYAVTGRLSYLFNWGKAPLVARY
jgi:outer membrane immunogenic protein